MFFGCKKAGKLYWALRRNRVPDPKASRLTLLAWFTLRDSSVDVIIDYAQARRSGYLVYAKGSGTIGYQRFQHTWYNFPIRRVESGNDTDLMIDHNAWSSIKDPRDSLVALPDGTLIKVKKGVFAGAL